MPHFVPVYDPERPRAEQNAADPALRIHRRWETPHALLSAVSGEKKDGRALKLKPVRSHMIRNEKGLWVPVARAKAEAARREQEQERVRRKWGGLSWLHGEKEEREEGQTFGVARARDADRHHAGERETGEAESGKSEQFSAGGASAAPFAADEDGKRYPSECRGKGRSRSPSRNSRPRRDSGSDSLRGRRIEGEGTPFFYERGTNRHRFAAEDAEAHVKCTSSYYRKESRDELEEPPKRREISRRGMASEFERETRDRRSWSPSSARCGHAHPRGYADDRRKLHEQQRHPTHEREVTLTNVTAPSGKIDKYDYMTKKQKALLRQQLSSQSALPSRR